MWSPCLNIVKVMLSLISLLNDPNPNSPMRGDIASMFKKDRKKYNELVRSETAKYAMTEKPKVVIKAKAPAPKAAPKAKEAPTKAAKAPAKKRDTKAASKAKNK